MRVSKQEAARTRERIIAAAAAEFRRKGLAETGLSDLMTAAGLTHGGFYRHFESKNEVVAEACVAAIESIATMLAVAPDSRRNGLDVITARYLSKDHRDGRSKGCPFASLGSELVRADKHTRAVATEGLLKIVNTLSRHFKGTRPDVVRRRALVALSTMVGALTLSRMMTQTELSDLLLQDAAEHVSAEQQ
jgi:TetR/AcrR family transcriptional regulator, transcriptional repressor for nem operon